MLIPTVWYLRRASLRQPITWRAHRLAGLFLDALPYDAHTKASDALWAGLPLLTLLGQAFAGRVAASLLNVLELPELIARSREEYEERAIELALDPQKLHGLKERLDKRRLTPPLFDTLFARHMEAAFEAMYRQHQAGLQPDHIEIPSGRSARPPRERGVVLLGSG